MKNNLMAMNNKEQLTIGSREVAEMMEMEHSKLLRKIDSINEDLLGSKVSSAKYWVESSYKDSSGKSNKEFLVTKMGCDFLAYVTMGNKENLFADRYMDRFEELESQVKSQVFKQENHMTSDSIERAKRWIKEEEARLLLEAKLNEQQYKVKYHDKNTVDEGSFTTTELANKVGEIMGGRMSARTLNKFLYVAGIVDEKDKSYEMTPEYSEKGWHCYKRGLSKQLRWTNRAMREIPEFMVKRFGVI